jgi:hypothetical protein
MTLCVVMKGYEQQTRAFQIMLYDTVGTGKIRGMHWQYTGYALAIHRVYTGNKRGMH